MKHKDIRLLHVFPLRGPSLWTYRPVLEAWVDIGDLEECPSHKIPGFTDRLCAWLPSLAEHRCSYGEPGGFVRRLHEGTWPAHILEHVTLELQNLVGMPGGFGRARETAERGIYKVVVSAWDEEVARACLEEARDLVMAAIEDRPFELEDCLRRLRELAKHKCFDPGTECIVLAATAKDRGIPAIRLSSGNLVQLGHGARQRRIWGALSDRTGAIADGIARRPDLTNRLLESSGLPVPLRRHVSSAAEAWEAAEEIGLPVLLKPGGFAPGEDGTKAASRTEVEGVYQELAANQADVVIEAATSGHSHRLLIVNGAMLTAARLDDGDGQDVSRLVHPATIAAACLASRVVGLDIAGVDVVADDIAAPLAAQHGAITAVHGSPPLHPFLASSPAASRAIGRAIVDYLFPEDDQGRVPVVGVTGSRNTTEVARLIAEFLRLGGSLTGLACASGLFSNRRQVEHGDCANWQHARRVLMNRSVEAAVIENNADVILGQGLAYDRCQVGVVTGIEPELHYGRFHLHTPEHVFRVFRTQVDVVLPDGTAVLPADNPLAVEMIPLCDGEVILFAGNPALPLLVAHRTDGGRVVTVHQDHVVLATAADETALAPLTGIPFLSSGLHPGRVASVLAAVAAAWALGLPLHVIRTGLETFSSHPAGPDAPVPLNPAAPGSIGNPP